jgi:hypothetical protein
VVQSQPRKNSSQDPISKTPLQKRAGEMAQMAECLPSKHEALSSTPVPQKKKKKKRKDNTLAPKYQHLWMLTSFT